MRTERDYYVVPDDSPVMAKIKEAEDQHRKFCEAVAALREEFLAEDAMTYGGRLSGLVFPESADVPAGWRFSATKGYATPDGRTKQGRELKARIEAFPRGMDGWTFSFLIGFLHFSDAHVHFSNYEQIGGVTVLSIPNGLTETPEGCTKLLMSEYWAMKERAAG